MGPPLSRRGVRPLPRGRYFGFVAGSVNLISAAGALRARLAECYFNGGMRLRRGPKIGGPLCHPYKRKETMPWNPAPSLIGSLATSILSVTEL